MSLITSEAAVAFSRSRLLGRVATGLISIALWASVPKSVQAGHGTPPSPCFGFGECHCCTGSNCCSSGCTWPGGGHTHCPSGGQCWTTCVNVPDPIPDELYRCCDWHDTLGDVDHCVCREYLGTC